uniref:97R n=1 Tax=Porcine adenovirus A serotype 3 TaxID=35265 RepID=Q9IGT5_ADEP3|nr:97R [Porcine adenovirus 3]
MPTPRVCPPPSACSSRTSSTTTATRTPMTGSSTAPAPRTQPSSGSTCTPPRDSCPCISTSNTRSTAASRRYTRPCKTENAGHAIIVPNIHKLYYYSQ